MTSLLSDEWFEQMAAAAAKARPPADIELTIEQVIVDGARWSVRIAGGVVEFRPEGDPDADVQIITDASTAAGIRAGTTSAQRAFLDGQLRIGGDVAALIEHREALAALGLGLG